MATLNDLGLLSLPAQVQENKNNIQTILNKNYVTTADLNTALSSYVTSTSLSNTLNNYVTSTSLSNTLNNYVTSSALTTALASYVTNTTYTTGMNSKQDKLVSGTNIKTINGNSILGNGNIVISSSQGAYRHRITIDGKINNKSIQIYFDMTLPTNAVITTIPDLAQLIKYGTTALTWYRDESDPEDEHDYYYSTILRYDDQYSLFNASLLGYVNSSFSEEQVVTVNRIYDNIL